MRIIGDPGSCHDGSITKARNLIEIASTCRMDAVKFQLITEKEAVGGNIALPWEWLPELIALGEKKGVEVFASVFDRAGWDWVIECGCKSVKLAYSQAHKIADYPISRTIETLYVSRDVMSKKIPKPPGVVNLVQLFCVPLYPIPYIVDFESIFPRFDGFSDHTLGIEQSIRAVKSGAKYLEFHFQGMWESDTPDGNFAKTPEMAIKLCREIKK